MKLHLADDLKVPVDIVTEKLAFLGRTGSGKSYAAQKLAEEMFAAKAQIVALDPVGNWFGLRLAADGKSPGLPIPVFGGLQGDIPLAPTGGNLMADLIVDRGISAVLDVSQFEVDTDKARFCRDFATRFFYRKKSAPSAVHLFIEEAQEFIPQEPQKDETLMLHAFQRLWKLGRNFGIGGSLISQRPQEMHKKVLNLTEVLFAFQLTGPHERKAVERWISEKGIDEDINAELPKLETGHPHVWSPARLKISRVVHIAAKTTLDASATPKVGTKARRRNLSPIDLEKIRTQMEEVIQTAKATDPRELQKRIRELETQQKSAPVLTVAKNQNTEMRTQLKEAVATNAILRRGLEGAMKFIVNISTKGLEALEKGIDEEKLKAAVETATSEMAKTINRSIAADRKTLSDIRKQCDAVLKSLGEKLSSQTPITINIEPQAPFKVETSAPPPVSVPRSVTANGTAGLGKKMKYRMMVALAQDQGGLSRERLAARAIAAVSGGSFTGRLSELVKAGFVREENDRIYPTVEGLTELGEYEPLPTGQALLDWWRQKLGTAMKLRMFDVLVKHWPQAISFEQLGAEAGATREGGSFSGRLSELRSLGIVESVGKQQIKASDSLFQ